MKLSEIPHTHYICTAAQSQSLDKKTIEDFGIPGYTLMEVAGSKCSYHILQEEQQGNHGIFLCGKGNNGGDALVVARYLVQHNIEVTVVFISGVDNLSDDAQKNFKLLKKMSNREFHRPNIHFITSWQPEELTESYDFLVDGMLGTGLDSDLRGDYDKAVEWANKLDLRSYAIDIPTGLNADTGIVMGKALKADRTFTFGGLKQGFFLNYGPEITGEATYCDLPFPNYLKEDFNTAQIDESWVYNSHSISRNPAPHKYEAGIVYVIAGSEGLTGAATMSAKSAWAEGVGAVILICPRGLLSVFETNLTQVITRPVGSENDYYLKDKHLEDIIDVLAEKPGKVIYGPGIGRNKETVSLTHQFLQQFQGSMLIDADGLWCLAQQEWEVNREQEIILTPHPGELSRFIDGNISDGFDRLNAVRTFAKERGVYLLSKGYPVILGTPAGNCYLTNYDTRRFSRAGFGDVLAGKIGAFWTLCERAELASWHALLNGKKKMENLDQHIEKTHFPEPLDLI